MVDYRSARREMMILLAYADRKGLLKAANMIEDILRGKCEPAITGDAGDVQTWIRWYSIAMDVDMREAGKAHRDHLRSGKAEERLITRLDRVQERMAAAKGGR